MKKLLLLLCFLAADRAFAQCGPTGTQVKINGITVCAPKPQPPVFACVGTPGDTAGPYGSLCEVRATGAIYACTNAAGCTVAADWTVQGGAAYPGVTADGSSGLNVAGSLTIGSGGTATQLRTTCAYIGAGSPSLPAATAVAVGTFMQTCDALTASDLATGGGIVKKWIYSDGSQWLNAPAPMAVSSPLSWNSSTLALTCPTCTITIASGTAALGTSAIGAGACATVVTVAATGVATTDVVLASFNNDPSADTGYVPGAALDIRPYPTANNVNFRVCNGTGSSITPSARTLNWRVVR